MTFTPIPERPAAGAESTASPTARARPLFLIAG
jgi:hypothetical protein